MYLFGSYARGQATPTSDLDFRINRGCIRSLIELSALHMELEEQLGKKVDLLTSQNIDPDFLAAIQAEEILIYQRA